MKHITILTLALLIFLSATTQANAFSWSFYFPPCFPFCTVKTTPTPTPKPTVAPTPTISPTMGVTPTITPTPVQSGAIYQGAFVGSQPYNVNDINTFEAASGKKLSIVMWYQSFGVTDGTQNFQQAWMDLVRTHGSIPMVTMESWDYTQGVNQPKYSLKNIANGNFDTLLTKWAVDSKNWNHPYFFRFDHEMNGNWYSWDEGVNGNVAGDYVKAFRHVHDIFVNNGATLVSFVWSPNVVYSGSTSLAELYPGDSYVDWVGMDGYNWGVTNGGWQEFTNLFTPTYNQIKAITSKPVMVAETASSESGGNKANWITAAYGAGIDTMPNIKAIIWFNQNKEQNWTIQSSNASQTAFKNAIANSKYFANEFGGVNAKP